MQAPAPHTRRDVGRVVVALLAATLLVCGCTVSQPSAEDWRSAARTSLEDVAGEVADVQLTLRQHTDGRVWKAYAVTLVADAETAVGTSSESVGTMQTPPGLDAEATKVSELLGRAEDAVAAARQAVVAGDPITDELREELAKVHAALMKEASSL